MYDLVERCVFLLYFYMLSVFLCVFLWYVCGVFVFVYFYLFFFSGGPLGDLWATPGTF